MPCTIIIIFQPGPYIVKKLKYFLTICWYITQSYSDHQSATQRKTYPRRAYKMSSLLLPRLPPTLIKKIAGFAPGQIQRNYTEYVLSIETQCGYDQHIFSIKTQGDYAEYVLSIFRAFMPHENDDQCTDYYKENVQQYLAALVYDALYELYTPQNDHHEIFLLDTLTLSSQDIMDLYETTFVSHYSQTYGWSETPNLADEDDDKWLQTFINITQLLEHYTTLCESGEIMGRVSYPMNVKDLKFITLLERSLRGRRADLLTFIRAHMYAPIMAFYLYAKHNHIDYRTDQNSLANDEWLLDLLLHNGYQKELLALAIGGLFTNDFVYEETSRTDDIIIEEHMVMPNREVVKNIIDQFPSIRDELIPFYMRSRIEVEIDEVYGEEGPAEITPLGYWQDYKNTFEERTHIDRSNDIFRKRTITVAKDDSIRMCLLAH